MFKLCVCISLIFIAIIIVSPCAAQEGVPTEMGKEVVIIEDNELYENNLTGIRIRGNIPIAIKACKIHSNGRQAIYVDGRTIAVGKYPQVMVTGCDLFQNGRSGVNIEEAARATVENSRIYKNKKGGIRIRRSGEQKGGLLKVEIANNSVYSNDQAGIRSMVEPDGEVDLVVVGNNVYKNKRAGIRVENNTKLTAKGNNIYGNGQAGIISFESVIPPTLDIYQNTVSFNRQSGIHILTGVTGRIGIRNNLIFNNHLSGIICALWGSSTSQMLNIDIMNNTIVSNGSSNEGAGVRNDSKGKATIMNNIIAYNYVTGIRTRKCEEDSHNLVFANGDVGVCCDDPHSAPVRVESVQFASCRARGEADLICDPL